MNDKGIIYLGLIKYEKFKNDNNVQNRMKTKRFQSR